MSFGTSIGIPNRDSNGIGLLKYGIRAKRKGKILQRLLDIK
jgi:hypothetical protein